MSEHLREAVFHSLLAALMAEAALRLWRARAPSLQLRLRLFVVAVPLLLVPAFELFAPFRHSEAFVEEHALFAGERWSAVKVFGAGADQLWLLAFATLGVALLVLDLVPWLRERGAVRPGPSVACPPELEALVARLASALGSPPPAIELFDSPGPALYCRGVRRPALVLSTATLARLDPRQLEGALAHELSHLRRGDVLLGWILLAVRVVLAFNPVVQLLARAIALDAERRADELAARVTGRPLALASGLLEMFRASRASASTSEVLLGATLSRAREDAIEERCRRLLSAPQPAEPSLDLTRLAASAVAISTFLFFVT